VESELFGNLAADTMEIWYFITLLNKCIFIPLRVDSMTYNITNIQTATPPPFWLMLNRVPAESSPMIK
jgi:hypothetical protein